MCHAQERIARQQCSYQASYAGRQPRHAESAGRPVQSKHTQDALRKRATIGSHHQRRSGAPFFHQRERARVIDGVAANSNRFVVAAVLAFGANALAHPPNRGVIEQQRLHANLEKIHKAIQPANVRKLMRDDRFDLFFAQSG